MVEVSTHFKNKVVVLVVATLIALLPVYNLYWYFFVFFCILPINVFINIFCTMAKMTKSQLMDSLAARTNMSKKEVGTFMDVLAELAYMEVRNNGEFVIPGIGKLVKQNRAARMGRNPATGESIQIPAKTVVKFRVAKAAKDAVL